ncbi:PhzF family phenazine biosynthesis protein [Cochlodiniinecator piscidefendens]|uniref:PhzF family phenazine biosynthesis protein n=1 Tax=Cochlodiniinecator piscidefendens TaxID=2715756 RepID=UPI00140AFE27|nr:PhzF family phenazine biosynthesis protein [Cochlodiniinecator piscidefendens]
MGYAFDWVDAFTDQAFGGNGCVVVHGATDISFEDRLALVRETSLAECAYMIGSDVADFGVRYYLADKEIPMAGHPTIATVASLIDRRLVDMSSGQASFTLEVGAGVMDINVAVTDTGPMITMTQAAPVFGPRFDRGEIASIYGLNADDIIADPQAVSTGTPFCITVLRDKDALRRAVMDYEKLDIFRATSGVTRAELMEPFLVTLGGETPAGDTFSRLLLAPPSLPEDPFTGSATGCMGAYLWHHGLIEEPAFTAEQGHWMGRPGQARVEVLGPRDAITGVNVGGQGRVVMRGTLEI